MTILLTNDDGIWSEGLLVLYERLRKIGDVYVIAPDGERSSSSHSISLTRPIEVRCVDRGNRFFGYAISGTPADCVKFGASQILKRVPDLVVSGINPGPNDGYSVFYSGTVGAAREGALMGAQAVAVSVASFENPVYDTAADAAERVILTLLDHPLPSGVFLNVNIPAGGREAIRGTRLTRQGKAAFKEEYIQRVKPYGHEYFWLSTLPVELEGGIECDTVALAQGYITVTPLQADLTDEPTLKAYGGYFDK